MPIKEFCENPYCENTGSREVPVSVSRPSDQRRTLCATCEEAYTWGVQHGSMSAKVEGRLPPPNVDSHLLERQAAVIGALKEEPFLSGEQRSCLEGLWNFLHALLDRAEDRSQ